MRILFTLRRAAIILEGWLLNSVEWTSCSNPEGKLKIAMTKRDVAVTIISHKVGTNFLSSKTRQSFNRSVLNAHVCNYRNGLPHPESAQALQSVWTTLKNVQTASYDCKTFADNHLA